MNERLSGKLIVFTRYPEPGATKTRLIPAVEPQTAAEIHRIIVHSLLRTLQSLWQQHDIALEVQYHGGTPAQMVQWLGKEIPLRPQSEGDLGEKMHQAMVRSFQQGYGRVIILGSDVPQLTAVQITQALQALESHDVVLGPAEDGGYYLIGARKPVPHLFHGINWGTSVVRQQTLAKAQEKNTSVFQLEPLSDVDQPEDLWLMKDHFKWYKSPNSDPPLVSVIIPTLNESRTIGATLASLCMVPQIEVLVTDGGSSDGTHAIVEQFGARLVHSTRGRAKQMNHAAQIASSPVLLFLHADTHLPPQFTTLVTRALQQPEVVAGAFSLHIDNSAFSIRVVEWSANFRAQFRKLPYGDHALFMKRETFFDVGMFPDLPIMEDFEMVKRLKRLGKLIVLPQKVTTSARRWLVLGFFRATVINKLILLGYHLGLDPHRLAKLYAIHLRVDKGNYFSLHR